MGYAKYAEGMWYSDNADGKSLSQALKMNGFRKVVMVIFIHAVRDINQWD